MLGILFGFCYIEFVEDLRNNKPDKAAEEWKKLCAKIEEYLLFCNEIGTDIVNALLNHIQREIQPGTFVSVGLTAAEGKEGFYKKFGFDLNRGMGKYFEYKQR